uniref:Neur_chan_LBD domain-containing protein n=1 Tax=Meloidogyne hapla TaxID=6305 RepID=A0A1I8B3I7_MELHA
MIFLLSNLKLLILILFINILNALPFREHQSARSVNNEFVDNNDVDYGILHIFHEQKPEGESTTDKPFPAFDFMINNKNENNLIKEKPKNCTTQVQIIDKLLNGTGYNKYRIPAENGVDVGIEFWIQAITEINEITNDFEMDIYINERVRIKGPCAMDL